MSRLAVAALALAIAAPLHAAPRAFSVQDLVMFDRVSEAALSPDGRRVVLQLRETDYAANKGKSSLWTLPAAGGKATRLRDGANTPRWSHDGAAIWFLAAKDEVQQIWRMPAAGGEAEAISALPLDVGSYKLSPDGSRIAFTAEIFIDCSDDASPLACTTQRLDKPEDAKASGLLYDRLFVRHWDTWGDGRRSQLFVAALDDDGRLGEPVLVSKGLDGDIPSKPFGDDSEYAFSPDGTQIYFGVRTAGAEEAWSTNFDIHVVPVDGSAAARNLTADNPAWDAHPLPSADGKTLYYLAMKRPGFEADRFGIQALDLASGERREIAADWDRSAGAMKLSADGRTLYTAADDKGEHPLFAIDIASGKVTKLVGNGSVAGFDIGAKTLLVARNDLKTPTALFTTDLRGRNLKPISRFNAERYRDLRTGDYEFFTFKGANGATVQGYVVKPVGFRPGRQYPVAFIIHGGPQGAMNNGWSFRWNPQTYAGQGFAVVTINFHGSTGYGQAFTDSISQDWGGKPLEDLKLGWAAALRKYRFLDADRACALGASYGGYMINWIAGNWNEPWKCLVNHDGVFDTRAMGYETEELWFTEWENGGTVYDAPANYEKFNPLNHVKDWRVPMLVIQGDKDFRIPTAQSLATFSALQRRGIPSQLLVFPDENHWVLKPQNSVQWHQTVEAWLKRWTNP
ncbi:S9 family peptidase [Dokdonella sp.]|uniref:alpha/beta hydrolase family protein n=1 Tax=Dokdonella sp. TaxID=2291710 RepID=UPI0025C36E20|nr:S9 family peptidase [Dokdonella sp.]MBX3692062.1 S9 family peptidase [Dokdonella sp.]MCW5568762.1 S9 family peptidase [Dokdonella sp.]